MANFTKILKTVKEQADIKIAARANKKIAEELNALYKIVIPNPYRAQKIHEIRQLAENNAKRLVEEHRQKLRDLKDRFNKEIAGSDKKYMELERDYLRDCANGKDSSSRIITK